MSIVARVCLSSVHENNIDIALVAARSLLMMREASICAVCYLCVLETLCLALLMACDQPAGLPVLRSAAHAQAWACFMFFCAIYDVFLFTTYSGLCMFSGLLSTERCVPGLPLLTTDQHGNYEEVIHVLVKQTLDALQHGGSAFHGEATRAVEAVPEARFEEVKNQW